MLSSAGKQASNLATRLPVGNQAIAGVMGREASVVTPGPSSLEVAGESLENIHVLTALWLKNSRIPRSQPKRSSFAPLTFQEFLALSYPVKDTMTTPLSMLILAVLKRSYVTLHVFQTAAL